jgi:nickel-type superoxide dismutase maturation protease
VPESRGPIGVFRRRWRSQRFVVADASMRPALEPGDRLLADPKPLRDGPPAVGAIVVLDDPERPGRLLVKRVVAVDAAGDRVTVQGDALAVSRDSRAFGSVPRVRLLGVVWFRYLPRARRARFDGEGVPDVPKP